MYLEWTIPCGSGASTNDIDIICSQAATQEIGQIPKSGPTNILHKNLGHQNIVEVAWWQIHLTIHSQQYTHVLFHLEWMWEPFHVGLGPQPMHCDITCSHSVTQEFGQLMMFGANKYGGSGMMVDLSYHPQHTYVLIHLIIVRIGCGNHFMWVWGLNQCTLTSFVAKLLTRKFTNSWCLGQTNMVEVAWWWIHLTIPSIQMFYHILCMFGVDVETIPCESGASTNAPWHYLEPCCDPGIWPTHDVWGRQIWWKWHDGGSIWSPTTYKCSHTPCVS